MKCRYALSPLILIIVILVGTYLESKATLGQSSSDYQPSGILAADLSDELPPGRLNVRLLPQKTVDEVNSERSPGLTTSRAPIESNIVDAVPEITPEIESLANGLERDPLAIFDYVHNHIEYVPSWGLLKNPRETLLAKMGNAVEQSALLSVLLNSAGFETRYVWGQIRISKSTTLNWTGASDPDAVGNLFASGGIQTISTGDDLLIDHMWVEVMVDGTWHPLDPSFKEYEEQAGQDLSTLLGFDQDTFLNTAIEGATITDDSVQNLDHVSIRNNLAQYATNFINNLRINEPFVTLEDVIGGRQIIPVESATYPDPADLPYTPGTSLQRGSSLPDELHYTLNIQLPSVNFTARTSEIAGERITIFYECATEADCSRLKAAGDIFSVSPAYQVNVKPVLRIGGVVQAKGDTITLGALGQRLNLTITTPDNDIFRTAQFLTAGAWYALPLRLQTISNNQLDRQISLLDDSIAQGRTLDDEEVLGGLLNLLGLSYYNEVELGNTIDAQLSEVVHLPHFSIMIAARNISTFVDLQQRPVRLEPGFHSVDVRLSIETAISAQNPADATRERAWFLSSGMRGSAVEHAILEQLQKAPALSTVQILNAAIEDGQPIYYITPDNDEIISQLGHSSNVLGAIENDIIENERHILISQNPILLGQWQGSGWVSLDPKSGSAGYLISGFLDPSIEGTPLILHGGSQIYPQPPNKTLLIYFEIQKIRRKKRDKNRLFLLGDKQKTIKEIAKQQPLDPDVVDSPDDTPGRFIGDPVDVVTGSFVYSHEDLPKLGGDGIPLQFERFYSSSQHQNNSPLGFGWNHTYNMQLSTGTDWPRGFGERMALEAAASLAAAQVGLDLFDTDDFRQSFAPDVVTTQWLMTQITGNAITISEPNDIAATHVQLGDGTYQPPTGSRNLSEVTVNDNGQTTLQWVDGTSTHFDAEGRLSSFEDTHSHITRLTYDDSGLLSQIADSVGRQLTLAYNEQNQISTLTDSANRTFSYTYDTLGNLQSYTDPNGHVTTYAYANEHYMVSITDPTNITFVTNEYDVLGQVVVQTNGRGHQTRLFYGGNRTIVVDPLGNRTIYTYDNRDRLVEVEDALGMQISIQHDGADHPISLTSVDGAITFTYDSTGNLSTAIDTLGHIETWAYDKSYLPIRYTDKHGKSWQFTYNEQYDLTDITDPLGGIVTYSYNTQGQLIQAQDAMGLFATYAYDIHGNLTSIKFHDQEIGWTYDVVGRVTDSIDGVGNIIKYVYDANGNLTQRTEPLGGQTAYVYDANGNLTERIDANNHSTIYSYDAQFNLTHVTDELGSVTTYTYDANDDLVQLIDANDHQTIYERNPLGQIISITDPLMRTVTYTYNANGQLIEYGRPDDSVIRYQRDPMGRLIIIDYPNTPDITFTYDVSGNKISAAHGQTWQANYQYDDRGQLTLIEDTNRNLKSMYTYDLAGRRTGLRVERDSKILYDSVYIYNEAAQLVSVADETNEASEVIHFEYDMAGRLSKITDPSKSSSSYEYDGNGRPVAITHRNSQGELIAAYTYTYDNVDNATAINEMTPIHSEDIVYAYDEVDRLIREASARRQIDYVYDPVGNLIRRTDGRGILVYTYDEADQLQTRGSNLFTYDDLGNWRTWQHANGIHTYSYDDENLLSTVIFADGSEMAISYDAFGRRISIDAPSGQRDFLYDGFNILLEGDPTLQQPIARYLHGNSLVLGRYTEQLGFASYHGDGMENVRYILDSNGQPFHRYSYEAFGRTIQSTGIDPNPYRYLGQRNVRNVGGLSWPTLFTFYREYNVLNNRFSTRDPLSGNLWRSKTINDYAYGLGNPLSYPDPTGLRAIPDDAPIDLDENPENVLAMSIQLEGFLLRSPQTTLNLSAKRKKARPVALTRDQNFPVEIAFMSPGFEKYSGRVLPKDDVQQWLPITGYGSVYALTCTTGHGLLAGSFQDGLLQSIDSPYNVWKLLYEDSISHILTMNDTFYVGTWSNGLLRSQDSGSKWTFVNEGLLSNTIYALAIDPNVPNRLFTGTEQGLFVSINGGNTWSQSEGDLPGYSVTSLTFSDATLLAITDMGLYLSQDGGTSWQPPTQNLPPVQINVLQADITTGTVYVGSSIGLYRSIDNGSNWTLVSVDLQGQNIHAVAANPSDNNHLIVGTTGGLLHSYDSGDTWQADTFSGLDGIASQIRNIAVCSDDSGVNLYLGTGGGLYALRTPTAPDSVGLKGLIQGELGVNYTFTATVSPADTTLPISYTWQASDYPVINDNNGSLLETHSYTWNTAGTKTITVTVNNGLGPTMTAVHSIQVEPATIAPNSVSVNGSSQATVGMTRIFSATVTPVDTSQPLSYTWQATDHPTIIHTGRGLFDTNSYSWGTTGTKTITVSVDNSLGSTVAGVHKIQVKSVIVPPTTVSIKGLNQATVGMTSIFSATVAPADTSQPLTYTWQATGHPTVIHSNKGLFDTNSYSWNTAGTKTITITVDNGSGTIVFENHTIEVENVVIAPEAVTINGPNQATVRMTSAFSATVAPADATQPIRYTWQATDLPAVIHENGRSLDMVEFMWTIAGTKAITVTAENGAGKSVAAVYAVQIIEPISPVSVTVKGPTSGEVDTPYTFTAIVGPLDITPPVTYTWQMTDKEPVEGTGSFAQTITHQWQTPGEKTIKVMVGNGRGDPVTFSYTICIENCPRYLPIILNDIRP
ncbi:MAG: DUF6531 domain-containing protein [Chloroflexota bacterium]